MPTILIAGATGNTGRSVVGTLPELLQGSNGLSGHRIIALTRSLNSPSAQQLAKIPGVEVVEQSWVEITADWLRQNEVVRAFIASHSEPNQFAEESTFLVAALKAGVKYVVRISTTAANVHPDCGSYYARSHWAIEALLSSPEFKPLQWTSLQASVFSPLYMSAAAEFIKEYQKTGKQGTLNLIGSADAPLGIIDPYDIGVLAAHLLAQENPSAHNNAKYVLNGPEDITGNQVVKMVEQHIGVPVQDVRFKDTSFVEYMVSVSPESKNVISSIRYGLEVCWEGKVSASMTSKEVLELAAPKRLPADALRALLDG